MVRIDFDGGGDVAFFRQGCAGLIRLTRPAALNSLNQGMTDAITRAFQAWKEDDNVALIVIEGEGRAFCAGGDVVAVWHALAAGKDVRPYFAAEYCLNSLIGHFPKPCISLLDGFVMGGGAGLSMHGSHRIVTPNTRFAMPESAIGFFPDVGMGTLLATMAGSFGYYLGLTGEQITQGDCLQLGLATHAIRYEDWSIIYQQLIDKGDVEQLNEFAQPLDFDTSLDERKVIADCFAAATVPDIITKLEKRIQKKDDFAARTCNILKTRSPLSLHIIHKHLKLSRDLTLDACLQLDYQLACHILENGDFYEGVRARLIDKDNTPHWQFSSLDDITTDKIAAYFMPEYVLKM